MKRKLSLHRETVRLLVEPELRGALGLSLSDATSSPYNSCVPCNSLRYCTYWCNTANCNETATACSNQPPCW